MVIIWLVIWSHTESFGLLTQLYSLPQPVLLMPVKTRHMFQTNSVEVPPSQLLRPISARCMIPVSPAMWWNEFRWRTQLPTSSGPGTFSSVAVTCQVPRICLCTQHHHQKHQNVQGRCCASETFFLTFNCKHRVVIRKYYIALPGMSLQAKPVSHLG